jgi:hypothetical protein
LGLPSGGASIEPDAYAEFAGDCGAASICALMAGAVAEGVVLGGYDSVGLKEDWRRATERLRRLGYDDGGAMLWGWTIDLLHEHEDMIVRLATELWRASWLDQAEIDALLAESACGWMVARRRWRQLPCACSTWTGARFIPPSGATVRDRPSGDPSFLGQASAAGSI